MADERRVHEQRTPGELAARLEWWLAYFDNDANRSRHPDFTVDPAGFDESAIEPDLRAAATALREMEGTRIEVFMEQGMFAKMVEFKGEARTLTEIVTTFPQLDSDESAILILTDPREKNDDPEIRI